MGGAVPGSPPLTSDSYIDIYVGCGSRSSHAPPARSHAGRKLGCEARDEEGALRGSVSRRVEDNCLCAYIYILKYTRIGPGQNHMAYVLFTVMILEKLSRCAALT